MKYILKITLLLWTLLMVLSCGTESSLTNTPQSKLSVVLKKSSLDRSSNRLELDLLLRNDYARDIKVSLESLNISIESCTIQDMTLTPKKIKFSTKVKELNIYANIALNKKCNPLSFYLKGDTKLALIDGSRNSINYKSSEIGIELDSDINGSIGTTDRNESVSPTDEPYSFYNVPKEIEIDKPNFEYSFKVQVVDSEEKIVSGQEVSILAYDVSYGEISNMSSTTDYNGFATFLFTSAKSLKGLENKLLSLRLKLEHAGVKKEATVNLKFKESSSEGSNSNYNFINPVKLTVETPLSEQTIFVDLVDSQGVGVPSKEIRITTPDSKYGSISSSSAITNSSGRATFIYKSPIDIKSIDKETVAISLSFTEEEVTITTKATLKFDATPPETSESNYNLINATNLIIDTASQEKSISIDLVDNQGVGIENKEIKISTPDKRFGFIQNSKSTTNSSGRATFIYTAPSDITSIDAESTEVKLTFTENGVTISKIVTIQIVKKSSINYRIVNAVDLLVKYPSHEYQIDAYLVDDRGVAVSGKKIEITTPNSKFGTLVSSTEETAPSTGKVSFTYNSPEDIKAIDGEISTLTIIFTKDNIEIKKTIQLTFMAGVESSTLPTVVIPDELKEIILSSNSQTIEIPIRVFKDIVPYTEGSVKIQLPEKVLEGVDVGSFSSFSVPINDAGVALLTYTGPTNLKALIDKGDLNSIFKIYHSENTDNENRESLIVKYDVSEDDYIPINYDLTIITQNSDFSMAIPNIEKTFSVLLKDSNGNTINNNDINITSIEVETENALIAQLFDSNSSTLVDKLLLTEKNNTPFILKSKTLSGLVPIKVTMTFKDINNKVEVLSRVINVRIMSGLPSAISITYLSSSQDSERAKYEEKFVVSVTDEYSNKVNTKPYISLGAVVGYAVDGRESSSIESSNSRRLFYGKRDIDSGIAKGIIDNLDDKDVHTTSFSDTTSARSTVFQHVNIEGENSDKLLIFGRGKSYDAMGKWDFIKIDDSILKLQDDYFGETQQELYYAVGHNYYQDQCLDDGREWLGTTDSQSYQLDDEGSVIISYKYDYQLMGKDALVWVNLNGYQPKIAKKIRIGEVLKHTLRGEGLIQVPADGYSLDKNATTSATFEIWQKNSSKPYRNAHFGWSVKAGSSCEIVSYHSSNSLDARTCSNGYSNEGRGYITFNLKAPEDKSCTFNIDRVLIAHEF